MALEKSRFFDSVGDDRTYQAEQFAEYFRMFLSDGIRNAGTNLEVRASGAGLSVQVDYGMAMIQGYAYWLEDNLEGKMLLQLPAASTLPRIDRVVLRLNKSLQERTVRLAVLGGTPAANPQAPQLTRTGNVYDLSLAQVMIAGNATTITDNNITDERLSEHCGLISSLIDLDSASFDRKANEILHNLENQGYMPLTGGDFDGDVGMGEHRLTSLGDPQADGDAVNKMYADATYVSKTGQAADSAKLGGKAPTEYATSAQGTKADNALPRSSYTAADILGKLKTVDGSGSGLDADLLDGRQSHDFATSAQGTKADNALPKSSYTAADVLAKLKGVDGAGSGLDADTLDGLHGNALARAAHTHGLQDVLPAVQQSALNTTDNPARFATLNSVDGTYRYVLNLNYGTQNRGQLSLPYAATNGTQNQYISFRARYQETGGTPYWSAWERLYPTKYGTGNPPALPPGQIYLKI